MKKNVSNILLGMVGIITGYLVVANIWHITLLNQFEVYDFDGIQMEEVRKNIDTFEKKVEIINYYMADSSRFTEDDKKLLVESYQEIKDIINNSILLNYTGKKKINIKFLYQLDQNQSIKRTNTLQVLQVLEKYDPEIKGYTELHKADFLSDGYGKNETYLKPTLAYRYNVPFFQFEQMSKVTNQDILTRVYDYNEYIISINYLSDMIIKVGDLHA